MIATLSSKWNSKSRDSAAFLFRTSHSALCVSHLGFKYSKNRITISEMRSIHELRWNCDYVNNFDRSSNWKLNIVVRSEKPLPINHYFWLNQPSGQMTNSGFLWSLFQQPGWVSTVLRVLPLRYMGSYVWWLLLLTMFWFVLSFTDTGGIRFWPGRSVANSKGRSR